VRHNGRVDFDPTESRAFDVTRPNPAVASQAVPSAIRDELGIEVAGEQLGHTSGSTPRVSTSRGRSPSVPTRLQRWKRSGKTAG